MKNNWHQEVMRVHYKDTDQMGVGHHANYVSWFEVGRTEWMRHNGIAYSKMESIGLLLPVVDLNVNYRKPARYDERIAIYTKVAKISKARLQFDYQARRIDDLERNESQGEPDGELLASGSTLHMWLNQEWKPARIDKAAPDVYALLQSFE